MRILLALLLVSLIPTAGFAKGESGHSRFRVFGDYGLGFVKPADINSSLPALSPRPSDITQSTIYGGGLGIDIGPKFELAVSYEVQDGKTSNGGNTLEIIDNLIFANGNYYLHRSRGSFYVGAGVNYPIYSHLTTTLSGAKTDYDADKTLGYQANVGGSYMLGNHFSLFAEGGYQFVASGDVKTGGAALLNASGAKSKLDLSGLRVVGGVAVHF
jgi:predicted porin